MQLTDASAQMRISGHLRIVAKDVPLFLAPTSILLLLVTLEPGNQALTPLRIVIALAYVLFIPGYFLSMALFPGSDDLDGIERLGLSLGLSIAWVPILALILDALPWGLRLWPILIGQCLSVLVFTVIGVGRRARMPGVQAYTPDTTWRPGPWWHTLPRFEQNAYRVTFGALLLAGLAVIWTFVYSPPTEDVTAFYILGSEGMAEDFPRSTGVNRELTVTLGITHHDHVEQSYYVEVWVIDFWDPNRSSLVSSVGPVTLTDGETRELPVSWRMPWAGQDQLVEFLLFTNGDAEAIRSLRLFVDVNDS